VTDPVSGYPPGTPAFPDPGTTAGMLHDLFSVVAFFTLPIACWVMVRRFLSERRWVWAACSFVTPIVFLVLFFLSGIGFSQDAQFVDVAGVYQRACVTVGFAWLTLLALHLLGRVPATVAAGTRGR
jgi:hypothetical protein